MSSVEESPAQQAARRRRERREAKIREGGSARLDKITSLSGRPPASEDPSPAPRPAPSPAETTASAPEQPTQAAPKPAAVPPPSTDGDSPENIRAQQEYLRALLRAHPPQQQEQQKVEHDPMLRLLSAMMGGLPGAENTAPGSETGPQTGLQPDDLSAALGLPPFLSKLLLGQKRREPPSPEARQAEWRWRLGHAIFALLVGLYSLFIWWSSLATFGSNPPPPATVQNPWTILVTGELALGGARLLLGSQHTERGAVVQQTMRHAVQDLGILVFVIGVRQWWTGAGQRVTSG